MADVALSQLRFADYSLNLGSVPSKFDVAPETLLLSNSVVPTHSFKVENEIIAKADKAKALAEQVKRLTEEESVSKESKESSLVEKEVKEIKVIETEETKNDESPLLDLNFDIGLDEAKSGPVVVEAKAQQPSPVTQPTPTVLSHDAMVATMVEQTKQDKEVCYFYLECADWNMESAVELLKSMQAISN